MADRIFISYRHEDTSGYAGRIQDRLSERYDVFRDVLGIRPGEDFVEALERKLSDCRVLIPVIGRRWLTSTDEHGNRRLDQPRDFVRLEIAEALRRKLKVIPLFVDGAVPPREEELPTDLAPLARCQGIKASDTEFDSAMVRLLKEIARQLGPGRSKRALIVAFVVLTLCAINVCVYWMVRAQVVVSPTVSVPIESGSLEMKGAEVPEGQDLLAFQQFERDRVYVNADFKSARLSARTALGLNLPQEIRRISYLTRDPEVEGELCRTTFYLAPKEHGAPLDLRFAQKRTPGVTFRNFTLISRTTPIIVRINTVSSTGAQSRGPGCAKSIQVGDDVRSAGQLPVTIEVEPGSEMDFTFVPQTGDASSYAKASFPVFNLVPALNVRSLSRTPDLLLEGDSLAVERIEVNDDSLTVKAKGSGQAFRPLDRTKPLIFAALVLIDLCTFAFVSIPKKLRLSVLHR